MTNYIVLFQNETTNATSTIVDSGPDGWRGIKVNGTFDGAQVLVQLDHADNDFTTLQAYKFEKEDCKLVSPFRSGYRLRLQITNAGPSTNINATVL